MPKVHGEVGETGARMRLKRDGRGIISGVGGGRNEHTRSYVRFSGNGDGGTQDQGCVRGGRPACAHLEKEGGIISRAGRQQKKNERTLFVFPFFRSSACFVRLSHFAVNGDGGCTKACTKGAARWGKPVHTARA